jgi:NTP pyrophosphatase (non-canonical NTP hydrolase)
MDVGIVNMVLLAIKEERGRQDTLKVEGRFEHTPNEVPLLVGYGMLCEEVGEVARCILSMEGYVQEKLTVDDARKELIQVAAIAVAMVEGIQTNDPDKLVILI